MHHRLGWACDRARHEPPGPRRARLDSLTLGGFFFHFPILTEWSKDINMRGKFQSDRVQQTGLGDRSPFRTDSLVSLLQLRHPVTSQR